MSGACFSRAEVDQFVATKANLRASLARHDQTITVVCQDVEAQRAEFAAMGLPMDRLRLIPDQFPDGAGI